MVHPPIQASPIQAPMSQVLGACAVELADLAARCEGLQGALSAALLRANVQDAQALDLVTQSLAALSQYLDAMAVEVPDSWTLDPTPLAAALPLASLGDRLVASKTTTEAAGELCLFDAL
jgi:hypothetical protein